MSPLIRIPLDAATLVEAVPQVAPRVTASTLRIPVPREEKAGRWLRFRYTLKDGSPLLEGVGRCKLCRAADGAGNIEAILHELTFDPRNEAMFERLLHYDNGVRTGRPPPSPASRAKTKVPRAPALPRYSTAPPPPKNKLPPALPGKAPRGPGPTTGGAPRGPRESPHKLSHRGGVRDSAKLSTALRDALRPKPRSLRPGRGERGLGHVSEGDEARPLEVGAGEWEEARNLSRYLNVKMPALAKGKWNDERVLREALRMGLAALHRLAGPDLD